VDAGQRWHILRLHVEDQIPLATLARDCGVGERTLQRWHARYRTGGYGALGDTPRADRGTRRVDPDLVRLVERLALTRPRPTVATIHRVVAESCAATGQPAPSYSTVRSVVAGLDPGMVTLALDGPASYRDRHELLLRRRADVPNAVWQADHTMLDIHVLDQAGQRVRPWLSVVLDDHSRAVCGYLLAAGAPSAANTALALRQAIWHKAEPDWPQCGVPDVLYTDHGSDFTSHRIGDTLNALHVRVIHSAVGRPQGRGKSERFFGTINTELLTRLPGHITPRAASAPTAPTLGMPELDAAINAFVRAYNARPHRELRQSPSHRGGFEALFVAAARVGPGLGQGGACSEQVPGWPAGEHLTIVEVGRHLAQDRRGEQPTSPRTSRARRRPGATVVRRPGPRTPARRDPRRVRHHRTPSHDL